jgi:hypothetical protein
MSRQTKLGKLVKEGMNENNSDYSDNEEENYSDEEFTECTYLINTRIILKNRYSKRYV